MTFLTNNCETIAVIDRTARLSDTQDILDLMADLWFNGHCSRMAVYKESLNESFFDLKTGIAGELLQKFSNYRFKLAIIGDFSGYTSKSLKDFIYECNKGTLVFFKSDLDSAVKALTE
jgi:hypothetical protein